jgi:hypothetical protein
MAQSTERAARHFATRATITPEQWEVIRLEQRAADMAWCVPGSMAERLARLFEIEAATAGERP